MGEQVGLMGIGTVDDDEHDSDEPWEARAAPTYCLQNSRSNNDLTIRRFIYTSRVLNSRNSVFCTVRR
jgi:hypothetical protein